MNFKIVSIIGPDLTLANGTGSDTYLVGPAGEVTVTQGGVKTIFAPRTWAKITDTTP